MKKISLLNSLAIILLMIGLLFLINCDETLFGKLTINYPSIKTQIGVRLIDASTGLPVNTGNPRIFIEGPDKVQVRDIGGKETIKIVNGFAGMTLRSGTNPNLNNPVRVTVICRADGYLSTSRSLTITEHGGYDLFLKMVRIEDPPPGVSGIVHNELVISPTGENPFTVKIKTPTLIATGTSATITIPQGTIIRTKNGEPLSGSVTTRVMFFSNQNTESMEAFPGGFSSQVTLNSGTLADVTFLTAGFIAINMTDASGRVAKFFDPPLEIYMEIPSNTIDNLGNAIADGTEIPIWSYDEETGKWQQEPGVGVVRVSPENGNFYTTFYAEHLSWWNLDWFDNSCYQGATIIINNLSDCPGNSSVYFELLRTDGSFLSSMYHYLTPGVNEISFLWVPENTPALLKIKPNASSQPIAELYINDLCNGTYTTDIILPTSLVPVTASFVGYCPDNPNVQVKPNVSGWYRKVNEWGWTAAHVWNGEVTLCLEVNTTYIFGSVLDGTWYEYEFTVSQTEYNFEMELTQEICNSISFN